MLPRALGRARQGLAPAGRKVFIGNQQPATKFVAPLTQFQTRKFHVLEPRGEDATPLDVKYWTGKPAVAYNKFQIDLSKYDMKKILSAYDEQGNLVPDLNLKQTQDLSQHMDQVFNDVGAVHCTNTGMTTTAEFNAIVKVLMPSHMKYEGGANMRAPIEGNVYDTGAPREADLQYHHEMAYVNTSCKWVAFGAMEVTHNPMKGATYISENNGATDMLMDDPLGQKLIDKGVCYIRKLPDRKFFQDNNRDTSIVYNYWQTSTGSEDMEEAAEIMRSKGLQVEWEDSPIFGRYMVTKYYIDTFEYDPFSKRNTLYASVADDYAWFDSWPGLKDLPHWERPLKLTFGDGEVMTREDKQKWVDCYDKNGIPIIWEKGDIAIICNYRTAHGRPTYDLLPGEKRELGVILGETFERQGGIEGKY